MPSLKMALSRTLVILLVIAVTNSEIIPTEIDALVEEFRAINKVPGLGLSIVNITSGEVLAKGYGLMDREGGLPFQNKTRSLIASISKSFTAVTVCSVLTSLYPELGQDVLDVHIVKLAPAYNLTLSDRYRTERITFRDLLSHRTCLNSYGLGVTAGAYASRADRIYRYRYIPEKCSYRSRFEYSSAMFILAGDILSYIAGGVPFDSMIEQLLLQLEMRDSLIVSPTENYETLENMSRGYYLNMNGTIVKMNASIYNHSGAASGGIVSTAADMTKYMSFHLNRGKVNGVQIVPAEIFSWLYEASNHVGFDGNWLSLSPGTDPTAGGTHAYGLGLDIGFFDGWLKISHAGNLSPFTSLITLYPDLGIGIFATANGPGGGPSNLGPKWEQLHKKITQSLLGGYTKSSMSELPESLIRVQNIKNANSIKPSGGKKVKDYEVRAMIEPSTLVGVYGNPYEADMNIIFNGTALSLQYGIWGRGDLVSTGIDNIYSIQWTGDIVSILLAYAGGPPLGQFQLDFNKPSTLIYEDSGDAIEYVQNATIGTYPEIPWEEGSCKFA